MEDFRQQNLKKFSDWAAQHVKGAEKGEAHIFLDRLFQAFGQRGCLEVGGQSEFRIRKAREDGGGTAFADYVWKPVVLIEMKKRGVDLNRHYRQAFDYWTRLAPGRPRYVILCNFDQFWIYDFDSAQIDTPVDTVGLRELADHYKPLAFLFPTDEKPFFRNYHEEVTRKAADLLAECHRKLARRVDPARAQRFILQMLVALFAEDIGLLEQDLVRQVLDECTSPAVSFDLLGSLFEAMNTPQKAGGRFKDVDYFNGGLFAEPSPIELEHDEIAQLKGAARENWSKVRPEIFGTIFQHSMSSQERHSLGAHYTSPADIMKIVRPTIVGPWSEQIESARSLDRLVALRERMRTFRVLDPACGSGNFLYLAYRELKGLEMRLNERITEADPRHVTGQAGLGFVTARQFYGMDIVPFAVEVAKVTMMIARKLAIDEFHITEPALPLDNLDVNFLVGDALLDENGNQRPWPKADVIIGNPPFVGAKRLKPWRGGDYVSRLRKAYPEVPGMADYCVYWFRRAADHLPACTAKDPVAGRAGLVGTQNIRNNQSRVGGLDHVAQTGTIIEAVDNQPWSGEANVHVSIANWVKTKDPALLPPKRKLWFKADPQPGVLKRRKRGAGSAAKEYELTFREATSINSSLSDGVDLSGRHPLLANREPKRCFQGKIPGYDGFVLDNSQVEQVGGASEVVVPYLTGRELLNKFSIQRWIIDFGNRSLQEASRFPKAFRHVQKTVLPAVRAAYEDALRIGSDMAEARKEHLERWWQFWNRRDELSKKLSTMARYIGCSRVSRRPIMVFLDSCICPSDLIQVFAFEDDYSFGILQSRLHFDWLKSSSRLKVESDLRYSVRGVFETFPWPQNPSTKHVFKVASAARRVRESREPDATRVGLRALYRTIELPGAHPLKDAQRDLDQAVRDAFGFDSRSPDVQQLLDLNHALRAREENGEEVEPPGIPRSCLGKRKDLTTKDRISP